MRNNKYNNNNFSHRKNFLSADGQTAISSYGEVFEVGAQVGHEDKNAPNTFIESFDVDKESGEVLAFTTDGFCHIDFMYNLFSSTGLVEEYSNVEVAPNTQIIEDINNVDTNSKSYFVFNKTGVNEDGTYIGVSSAIIGDDTEEKFNRINAYIKENPDCGIITWATSGNPTVEDFKEEQCTTDVQSTYAIEEIKKERLEQINKHKFGMFHDLEWRNSELVKAAFYCIEPGTYDWPSVFDKKYEDKIDNKDLISRLVIAGAFVAAEIDRLKSVEYIREEAERERTETPEEYANRPMTPEECYTVVDNTAEV